MWFIWEQKNCSGLSERHRFDWKLCSTHLATPIPSKWWKDAERRDNRIESWEWHQFCACVCMYITLQVALNSSAPCQFSQPSNQPRICLSICSLSLAHPSLNSARRCVFSSSTLILMNTYSRVRFNQFSVCFDLFPHLCTIIISILIFGLARRLSPLSAPVSLLQSRSIYIHFCPMLWKPPP